MSPNLSDDQRWQEVHVGWAALRQPEEASRAAESYQNENFEIQMVEEDGKFLVYTRRPSKNVVVTDAVAALSLEVANGSSSSIASQSDPTLLADIRRYGKFDPTGCYQCGSCTLL
jgi:hypothetical protein